MTTITTRVGNLVIPRLPETELIVATSHSGSNSISIIALDGLNCGVPTRTTPTITPVTPTLCENLLAYQLESESHHNQAGFVPPLVQSMTSDSHSTSVSNAISYSESVGGGLHLSMVDTKIWQGGTATINDLPSMMHGMDGNNPSSVSPPIPPHVISMGSSCSSSSSSSSSNGRKNIGGRRPNKESGISPEEEHRRSLRRERNKQAAARCRKRRLDHTNQLILETEDLEKKKQQLSHQVAKVQEEVAKLRGLLETHDCKILSSGLDSPEDVKPFVLNPELSQMMANQKEIKIEPRNYSSEECITPHLNNNIPSTTTSILGSNGGKQRPNFLPINNSFLIKNLGVSITTPSTDFMDAFLQEGGTGLTPIASALATSSCSTQLRSSTGIDLSSPDPTVPSKRI